ncbi:zf-HC2 domain-containing protein [Mycobacterium shinjukuense]|nr:zf-HC2 domain-containing protein [Mycobacterium shinjukuense]MCV6986914.1 zf-HC2 domain-containing protein [Mycobacterium shinjukuense]
MRTPLRGLDPPSGDSDRYATWDAAYVLGSLSAADRREFEAHLAGCAACRESVAELCGVPALLSQLDRDDLAAIDESGPAPLAPQMLLPSLLATVRRRRRRIRVTTWVASAAAAAVLVICVLIGVGGQSASPQRPTVSALPMAQVGTTLLASTVSVSPEHWGTFINLRCVCLAPPDAPHDTLAMVVVGRDGSQTRLATWVAEPGQTATPAGSISTPVDQIAAVQVVYADTGQVLLQRSL